MNAAESVFPAVKKKTAGDFVLFVFGRRKRLNGSI
jgi:hypothetical protein